MLSTLVRSSLSLALSDSSLVSILRSWEEARCSEGRSAGAPEQMMSSRKSIAMLFREGLLSKSYKTRTMILLCIFPFHQRKRSKKVTSDYMNGNHITIPAIGKVNKFMGH